MVNNRSEDQHHRPEKSLSNEGKNERRNGIGNGSWLGNRSGKWVGKALYGALFILIIPLYLYWLTTNIALLPPNIEAPIIGIIVGILGLIAILVGMSDLFFRGKGLPMNAFPPKKLVINGLYGIVPHPIYVGFLMLLMGIALIIGSGVLLWIVTPIIALGIVALVYGYERPYLLKTFKNLPAPLLSLPNQDGWLRRLGGMIALFSIWLLLFESFKFWGAAEITYLAHLSGEYQLPVWVWSYPIYASAYGFIALPFFFASFSKFRAYLLQGWISLILVGLLYFTIPLISPVRVLPILSGEESALYQFFHQMLALEMEFAAPYNAAFPSYHVIWTVLVMGALWHQKGIIRTFSSIWGMLIIMSCFTTGMHALVDLIFGGIIGILLLNIKPIWRGVIALINRLGNSYDSFDIGSIRIMNHFIYSFSTGAIFVTISLILLGESAIFAIFLFGIIGALGAMIWGQLVEGSAVSQRPLGYFGSIIGLLLTTICGMALGYDLSIIVAAFLIAGSFAQAIGRLRCIVQGCCHGSKICEPHSKGFVINSERSRVVSLSHLKNVAIYPTQLYSLIGNAFIGTVLFRLWQLELNCSFIIGAYFILTGCLRFVEEGYRGEVQTKRWYGLAIYQWLAIGFLVIGTLFLTLEFSPIVMLNHTSIQLSSLFLWALLGGLISGVIGSVDFPKLNYRFSRLE